MPKGYMIAHVTVTDPDQYAVYAKMAGEAIRLHGGKPLARGGRYETMEGQSRARNVVLEFESYDKALAYVRSPEYQAAKTAREGAGICDMVVVEGFE